MTNLLPPSSLRSVTTEYRIRLVATTLFMLAAGLSIALILLIPSYLLASHRKNVVAENLAVLDKDTEASVREKGELEKILRGADSILAILAGKREPLRPSVRVIERIVSHKTPNIKLQKIFYDAHESGGTLSLRGIAANRQALVSFADALKRDSSFFDVNLPVSNLVKEREADFTIMLKLSATTTPSQTMGEGVAPPQDPS